jgi:hypothetical protein
MRLVRKNSIFDNNGQPGTNKLSTYNCQRREESLPAWILIAIMIETKKTPRKLPGA